MPGAVGRGAACVNAAVAVAGLGVDIAALVLNEDERRRLRDEKVRNRCDAVVGLAKKLFHHHIKNSKEYNCVVIYRASNKCVLCADKEQFVDNVEIGGATYSIYFARGGYIRNDGDRGFDNWCVYGDNVKRNNVIFMQS